MNRSERKIGLSLFGWMAMTFIAGALATQALAEDATTRRPPNFIIVFADDLGYGDLSCYGSKKIHTPHLDRMASQGMRFTSFYVAASVCTPSRAALLTGCYAQRVGLPGVLFPNCMEAGQADGKAIGLNPAEITLAELLKDQGYRTACVGKWHLGDLPVFMPNNHGFDEYFGLPYSNDMWPHNKKRDYPPLPLIRNGEVIETNPDQRFLTARYTEEAIRFIKDNKDKPFFLYLPHSMPHRPCHASPTFTQRFTKEQFESINKEDRRSFDFLYPAAVEEIDWSMGQILDTLKQMGLEENTLVLFTSDNGPAVGSARPLSGRKASMLEGGLRVPCIMQWKKAVPVGTTCDAMVTVMDFLPTLTHLAGGVMPKGRVIDGKDIRNLIEGQKDAKTPHEAFFYMTQKGKIAAVRSGKWKYFFKGPRLYDLSTDISERNNVVNDHPEIVARLRERVRQFEGNLKAHSRPVGSVPLPLPK